MTLAATIQLLTEELREQIEEDLRMLIACPTDSANEDLAGEVLSSRLLDSGIEVEMQRVEPNRHNVVARVGSHEGKTFAMNSHLDVVVAPEEGWHHPPFEPVCIEEESPEPEKKSKRVLCGRGSVDAKGSIAAMSGALRVLRLLHDKRLAKFDGQVVLTAVMGEETGGIGTKHLVRTGFRPDAVVVGEPTDLSIVTAHRGSLRRKLIFKGIEAHSSNPSAGLNPISCAGRFVAGLEDLHRTLSDKKVSALGSGTVTSTMIHGGHEGSSSVPDQCSVVIDRRLVPGEDSRQAETEIRALLSSVTKESPGLEVDVLDTGLDKPAVLIPSDERVVQCAIAAVGKLTGRATNPQAVSFGTDLGFFWDWQNIPGFVFGPGSIRDAHRVNERIDLDDVMFTTAVYAFTAIKYLGGGR